MKSKKLPFCCPTSLYDFLNRQFFILLLIVMMMWASFLVSYRDQFELKVPQIERPLVRKLFEKSSQWTKTKSGSVPCHVPPNSDFCAPSFIVAGTMKGATTSLFSYLVRHPNVLPLRNDSLGMPAAGSAGKNVTQLVPKPIIGEKEIRYFMQPNFGILSKAFNDDERVMNHYYSLFYNVVPSERKYSRHVTAENLEKENLDPTYTYENYITGEATPMYVCQYETHSLVKRYLPHAKVIILMRDPIARAYSEFHHRISLKIPGRPRKATAGEPLWKQCEANHTIAEKAFSACLDLDIALMRSCGFFQGIDEKTRKSSFRDVHIPVRNITDEELFSCSFRLLRVLRSAEVCNLPEYETVCKKWRPFIQSVLGENSTLLDICMAPHPLRNGAYAVEIRPWVNTFDPEQLLILRSEDLFANPVEVMEQVEQFLELPPLGKDAWKLLTSKTYNIHSGKGLKIGIDEIPSHYSPLSKEIRETYNEIMRPLNAEVEELIQRPLYWDQPKEYYYQK